MRAGGAAAARLHRELVLLPQTVTLVLVGFSVPAMVLLLLGWFYPVAALLTGTVAAAACVAASRRGADLVPVSERRTTTAARRAALGIAVVFVVATGPSRGRSCT